MCYTSVMKYKTSEAQRRANENYMKKHERVNVVFDLGTLDRIKKNGETANGFIKAAVLEKLEKLEKEKSI